MQQSFGRRQAMGPAIVGAVLIALGIAAMLLRQAGIELFEEIGEHGWPLFIIVPGLVLLALALLPAPPKGVGFAIAGAVVTTVGGILLYQSRFDHFESWAYAWALIPAFTGAALGLYGLFAHERAMTRTGIWMALVAGLVFVVGAWFFEGVFSNDRRIIDAGNWWPVAVIILGALFILRAFLFRGPQQPPDGPSATAMEPPAEPR
jgi:hypothetical protein